MPPSRSQKRRLTANAAEPSAAGAGDAASAAVSLGLVEVQSSAAGAGDAASAAVSLGLVEVLDTGTGRGHGLFAAAPIADGTYLGDYTGEVLTHREYLARYPAEDARYVLSANTDYNIDAADPSAASLLRFLNHSTSPNCFYDVQRVRRQRQKRVCFFTSRDVAAGEELCFDYGRQYWVGRGEEPLV